MAHNLASQLLQLAGGNGGSTAAAILDAAASPMETSPPAGAPAGNGSFTAAYIDTAECTACDECTNINPKIFAYNENKKAYVKDPKGGPFKDIVRAAEKCTAQVIHPGTPADPNEKDVEKLKKRAEKFN